MVLDDKQKLSEHLQLRPHAHFAAGSEVEVTSEEEGFRGIWFPAKLISPPSKKHKSKYLVEYKTLLSDENGSKPLVELVGPSLLRPALPAEEDAYFEVNDVVEAYHRDGWWVGVVIEVLGERGCRVFFNNPADEDHEVVFERSSLRVHKDWVDGKWVRPEKQDIAVISNAKVDSDPNMNGNGKINLRPENFGGANESAEESRNIQQEPAAPSEKLYVDNRTTPENFGGANERFCEKQNKESLPDVQFPQVVGTKATMPDDQNDGSPASLETPASDMEDNASMEAEGEKLDSSTNKRASYRRRRKRGRRRALVTAIRTPRKSAIKTPSASVKGTPLKKNTLNHAVTNAICENIVNEGDLVSNLNDIKDAAIIPMEKVKGTTDKKNALDHAVIDGICENTVNEGDHEKEDLTDKDTSPKMHDSLTVQGKANVDNTEEMLRIVGGTETIRKSTRKRKSVYESIVIALKPTRRKPRKTTETLSSTQEYEDSPKCKADSQPVSNNDSANISETDKPLSSWLIDSRSPPMMDPTQSEEKTHVPNETHEQNDADTVENATKMLPFTKTSSIWKIVESMEVFQQIPQNPHFQPLYETKQDCREGLAIGYMVTFSGLVEKISKLHFGDPKNVFDDSLETLSDLERQGFNVDLIRVRLKELISIKGGHENSQMVIDEVKKQIEEQQIQKAIIDEERNEIDKKISELRMQRELVVSRAEKLECEIEELESRMESVKGEIEADQAEFEKVVTAPW